VISYSSLSLPSPSLSVLSFLPFPSLSPYSKLHTLPSSPLSSSAANLDQTQHQIQTL